MTGPARLVVQEVATPLGGFALVADADGAIRAGEYADCPDRLARALDRQFGRRRYETRAGTVPPGAVAALRAYFDGDLRAIDGLALRPGGTPFQEAVWHALRLIPPGDPLGYAVLAARVGRANAARAVGHANGANPISILIPCHRLVGANGALTGYGGGIKRKRWLLDHEARPARAERG